MQCVKASNRCCDEPDNMINFVAKLVDKPYWAIALILGVVLVVFPCVTIDRNYRWSSHPPDTLVPVVVGILLVLISAAAFVLSLVRRDTVDRGAGIDLTHVKEDREALWTTVGGCEIRVVEGRIEDQSGVTGAAIALPCNEYFDDECVDDRRSALGAYVSRIFDGQVAAFGALTKEECKRRFGSGIPQQKADGVSGESFGVGRCVLLLNPLGHSLAVALVSTTTQRAGEGLASRISYLCDGMRELFTRLADARLNEVIMPVMGSGHGGIYRPLALVGLILAVAEAARYGQGAQRPKRVTIIVFRKDANSPSEVEAVVVRRALGLVGSRE